VSVTSDREGGLRGDPAGELAEGTASVLAGRTRETKIRRDALGRWFNDGVEITHPLLREAFDRWLRRAPDASGRYCLSNDINWAYVELEGPPRFVRAVRRVGGAVELSLSSGEQIELEGASLVQGPDEGLYCDAPGGLVARFDRHAVMQLEPLLEEDELGVFLNVRGAKVRPRVVRDPLAPR
jgi:hypothetical protein